MKNNRYHPTTVFLHWLMFLIFAAALAFIEYRGYLPKGDPLKKDLRNWHMLAGQLAFVFVVFRVSARWLFAAPIDVKGARWQTWSAKAVHIALYAVMFALPITGALYMQAGGKEVEFFGLILPHLTAEDAGLKTNLKYVHGLIGNGVYFRVGIHVLGALWHQFGLKDDGLRRMTFSAMKR